MKVHKEDFTWACKMALMEALEEADLDKNLLKVMNENFTLEDTKLILTEDNQKDLAVDIAKWYRDNPREVEYYINTPEEKGGGYKNLKMRATGEVEAKFFNKHGYFRHKEKMPGLNYGPETTKKDFHPITPPSKPAFKLSPGGKATAIVLGVTALIAAGYYAYKRFLSKAARACRGTSGKEKTRCMIQFKIKGAELAIQKLEDSKKYCSDKNNPEACVDSINKAIGRWQYRISKYKRKLT